MLLLGRFRLHAGGTLWRRQQDLAEVLKARRNGGRFGEKNNEGTNIGSLSLYCIYIYLYLVIYLFIYKLYIGLVIFMLNHS